MKTKKDKWYVLVHFYYLLLAKKKFIKFFATIISKHLSGNEKYFTRDAKDMDNELFETFTQTKSATIKMENV